MRYFLDTQLYSYLANGAIRRREWLKALGARELWLSAVTAYELLEGLLNASPHTYPLSLAAIEEARAIPEERILARAGTGLGPVPPDPRSVAACPAEQVSKAEVRRWLELAASDRLPAGFYEFRGLINAGRRRFLAEIRGFMARVMPNYRSLGDPLFSPEWQAHTGRRPGEHLDAAFVFQTAVMERAMRIRYNPDKHPSDYLDYLQLRHLEREDLTFITADRKLARMVTRSLESDRVLVWEELVGKGVGFRA